MTTLDRFWAKVDASGGPDECWPWIAALDHDGYGMFRIAEGRRHHAHRAAWLLLVGDIPDGMHVCHSCDNPACVNPLHLWLGTDAANVRDCMNKGRRVPPRGERHGNAKLTADAVGEIRAFPGPLRPDAIRELTERYGISRAHVFRVRSKEQWACV